MWHFTTYCTWKILRNLSKEKYNLWSLTHRGKKCVKSQLDAQYIPLCSETGQSMWWAEDIMHKSVPQWILVSSLYYAWVTICVHYRRVLRLFRHLQMQILAPGIELPLFTCRSAHPCVWTLSGVFNKHLQSYLSSKTTVRFVLLMG